MLSPCIALCRLPPSFHCHNKHKGTFHPIFQVSANNVKQHLHHCQPLKSFTCKQPQFGFKMFTSALLRHTAAFPPILWPPLYYAVRNYVKDLRQVNIIVYLLSPCPESQLLLQNVIRLVRHDLSLEKPHWLASIT